MTDSLGNVVQTYEYDSFGNIINQVGSIENPYTFTGREWDEKAGLYYYRARYYDAAVGRFINNDPVGFAGGDVNFYAYVQNNPVNWRDPNGKGIYTLIACGVLSIWDVYSTAKQVDRLDKKIAEIRSEINDLSKEECPLSGENEVKRLEKIKGLEKLAHEKGLERIGALVKGSAWAVPIGILCKVSTKLPF